LPGNLSGYVSIEVNGSVEVNATYYNESSPQTPRVLTSFNAESGNAYIMYVRSNNTGKKALVAGYSLSFNHSGYSNVPWEIKISSSNGSIISEVESNSSEITFNDLPNSTYNFSLSPLNNTYRATPMNGKVSINGYNQIEQITFSLVNYTVTFYEKDLPSGTSWYVNLSNGQSYSSSTNTITFNETNGTYSYTIATSNKEYAPTQYSGSFIVNGAPVSESITFNPVTYKITFTESGLSSGTNWYVTLNGITKSSLNNTIIFNESNGSYSYTIQGISGYRANTYSGTINVNGNPVSVSINWTVITYSITITESGIQNGTSWSATLTGTTFNGQYINITLSSTTNTITFNEPNGSYSYIIHLPSGYQSNNAKGSVNVSGNSENATFTAQQTMNYLLIGIIAVIVIILVALGVIFLMRSKNKQKVMKQKEPPKEN